MKQLLLFVLIISSMVLPGQEFVTIAILAKDKAHTLPLYLSCIEQQTWPKQLTNIYIRTNNNTDETARVLREWVDRVGHLYNEIFFDDTNVPEKVEQYAQHEWNCTRFKVLGKIRQESVEWAKQHDSHYFVADCDNFIKPHTIQALLDTNLPVIAPFLRTTSSYYSNFHAAVDKNGYYENSELYYHIYNNQITGIIQVPVVHCTYLVRKEVLEYVSYDDDSYRYEYVIFSDLLRKAGIPQYIDNRELYGRITPAETADEFVREPWRTEFNQSLSAH